MTLFARRISEGEERIYEVRVPCADGREAYYRLSIDRLKEKSFKKACKEGLTVNLTDFGILLESCFVPNSTIIKPVTT